MDIIFSGFLILQSLSLYFVHDCSVNKSHVMEVQSEFMDTNNVLKQDLNKVRFYLKRRKYRSRKLF